MKKKILIAFGTRPEALKFAPLIKALKQSKHFKCYVCLTGQHRQMLDQVVDFFKIPIHANLGLMKTNQTLEYMSSRVLSQFGKIIQKIKPNLVFVQGDTATAVMVGISSFYARVPLAHLEAGLRTWNKCSPFPEEMNRQLISRLADYHFTPTQQATQNLIREGISRKAIFQVGNPVVDTIKIAAPLVKPKYPIFSRLDSRKRIIFVTAHRRESFGAGLGEIFQALKKIIQLHSDVQIVYPVHLNPKVLKAAQKTLGRISRIHLVRPLIYGETIWIMKKCHLILTDSGGIQEEAPTFGKPVLVLRDVTERTEGIKAGMAILTGARKNQIIKYTSRLLNSPKLYRSMTGKKNPYGDGLSSQRIVNHLKGILK